MLTRKQALLALALMTSLPLAGWAATEATQPATDSDNAVACPFGGPGQGVGPGMMQGQGRFFGKGDAQRGPRGDGRRGGFMHMNDNEALKAQLDDIKDPKVKAKYIEMVKARLAFEESQLESTKAFLDSQK